MNHVFCIVSCKVTENYTKLALDSFFKHTKIEPGDIFVFVNNDKTNAFKGQYPIDIYINNKIPKGWATNFNKGLRIAKRFKKHFVVITNDVVFTKNWLEVLKQTNDLILIPSCNINFMYRTKKFSTMPAMDLEDYIDKEPYLDAIADFHQNQFKFNDLCERIFMQMYLARIPYKIHSEVGLFDESFSMGGGEDMDYRIRAALKGYKTMIALHPFILHFHGKSTWNGAESTEQEKVRRDQYLKRGLEKWGEDLNEIFIKGTNAKEWAHKIGLGKQFDNNEQYNIIRTLTKC
jgi:GT2 family glycosyltransferase